MPLSLRRGTVTAVGERLEGLVRLEVDGETCVGFPRLTGPVALGDEVLVNTQARSHDHAKLTDLIREMLETFTFAASLGECDVETHVEEHFSGYRFRQSDEPVRIAVAALERTGYEPRFILSGGGADANVFNERGLQCLVLANGMTNIHSSDEHIAVADLEGMVEVTLALIDSARASG